MTDVLPSRAALDTASEPAPSAVVADPAVLLYPRLRRSPYFWKSRAHGVAMYSVYNHTYHPRHYGDPIAEYWALLEDVTLWDVGVERQIEITGPDAFAFTNMLVPRDLTKCAVGQCKYVFVTAPDGGIINDPVLLRVGEDRFWLSLADSDVGLWASGLAHAGGWDVSVREIDVAPVQVQGPKAKAVITDLFGSDVAGMPYYHLRHATLDGLDVVISRTGYSAEIGYEIYLYRATRDAGRLWDRVWEAGRPHGMRPIGPCHIRRIEGGMLAYGCDITLDTNPLEVGYDYTWMVDLDQEADFVGKDALIRAKQRGLTRSMVGLEIGGSRLGSFNDGSMIEPFTVWDDAGQAVGSVTSACWSPRLERNIGLAMVSLPSTPLGTTLRVSTLDDTREAVVVEKPFVDPRKQTPKG
ncbi:glycine cleavage T C-terminal barrel domain-containing protein [Actinomycetospora sp. TBRC 11914]|uniref:glycine cleavage T C-terminal barrel domain-containing protein n=1 Tax=Actinomycetospora sp. TBRC 11914 TaxID=2729387 RepID=UPI00145DDDFE|nr:glycine cleavage T C-terminal barrel domain-containing protein [Actinomycetospora sp. TBRC 11914]NMO92318.1 glycine cleavage system protein T [Actinomycetospora sp. TBRC 11914]